MIKDYVKCVELFMVLSQVDYVVLSAYDYCVQNNLIPAYCGLSDEGLARMLRSNQVDALPVVGSVLFNVHCPQDSDGPQDESLSLRIGSSSFDAETCTVLCEYYLHRYTSEDKVRPEFRRDKDPHRRSFDVYLSDGSVVKDCYELPKTGCELFEHIDNKERLPYELRYTFRNKKFRHLFGYNNELVFVWLEDLGFAGKIVCLANPEVFSVVHGDWMSEWCRGAEQYVIDDEFVRYNMLNRRYTTRQYILRNGRATTL